MAVETPKSRLQALLQSHVISCGSQSELARRVGYEVGTLNTYISGASFPKYENLKKLADYLGMTVEQLDSQLKGSEPKSASTRARESGDEYRVGLKAEDVLPMLTQLSIPEKIRLARFLLDVAVS